MKVGVETWQSLGLEGDDFSAKDSQGFQDLLGYVANVHTRVIPRSDDQTYGVRLGVVH